MGSLRRAYHYRGDSDQISSPSLFDGNRLFEQLSFEYDKNGVVVQQEWPCGSRTYTTKIRPVAKGPAIGFPERVEEYAGDKILGDDGRSGWEQPRTAGMEVDGRLYSVGTTSRGDIAALFDKDGRVAISSSLT